MREQVFLGFYEVPVVSNCKHDVSAQQWLWDGKYFVKCNICGFFMELEDSK